ncbi:MAG: S8 family serine peptidase [Blastocatellia bacterium]
MDTQKQTSLEECPTGQSNKNTKRSPFRNLPPLPQKRSLGWVCLLALLAGVGVYAHFTGDRAPSVLAASANESAENGINNDLERRIEDRQAQAAALQRDELVENRFRTLQQKMLPGGSLPVIVRLRIAYESEHKLEDPLDVAAQRALIERMQGETLRTLQGYDSASVKSYRYLPLLAVRVDAAGLASLTQSAAVIDIFEDAISLPAQTESSAGTGSALPGGADLGIAQVRQIGLTGIHQTIAILDTGLDKAHPSLAGKVVAEGCFSSASAEEGIQSVCPAGGRAIKEADSGLPCQIDGTGCEHGTQVASIAAGRKGVAPEANLIAVKVVSRLDAPGVCPEGANSCLFAFDSDLLQGLEYVYELRERFRIVAANVSLAGPLLGSNCDAEAAPLRLAVELLEGANIATITAAGNDGDSGGLSSPACVSSAISVGSFSTATSNALPGLPGGVLTGITQVEQVSAFSNSAEELDLLAPGQDVLVPTVGGGETRASGTSFSAASVAGAWALARQKSGIASVAEVRTALVATGRAINDSRNQLRRSRVNLDGAVIGLGTLAVMSAAPSAPNGAIAFPYMGDANLSAPHPYRIKITWRDNSNNELHFVIMRRTQAKPDWSAVGMVRANATSFMDVDIKPNTRYEYHIFAYNGAARSNASNIATVVSMSVRIAQPTNLTALAASASAITLNWTDNSRETGFAIMRQRRGTTSWEKIAMVPADTPTYTDQNLLPSTLYTYCVCAFDNAGDSDPSNEVKVVTLDERGFTPLPAAPSDLEISVIPSGPLGRYGQLELKWRDNSANESGFQIWRRAEAMNATWEHLTTLPPNSLFFLNTGLTTEMRYHYRVASFNGAGVSMSSEEVSAIPPMYNFSSVRSGQTVSGSLGRGSFQRYRVYVPEGTSQLAVVAQMRAQLSRGDVDIFVRRERLPTMTLSDCSSRSTSAVERCTINNPTPGDWYISVYGQGLGASPFEMTATTQERRVQQVPLPPVGQRP